QETSRTQAILSYTTLPALYNSTLFPYTTLFRSQWHVERPHRFGELHGREPDQSGAQHRRGDDGGGERRFVEEDHRRCEGRNSRRSESTRLNSSHQIISYAVFCLKKKKKQLI